MRLPLKPQNGDPARVLSADDKVGLRGIAPCGR
jgi:hypothetical protein